MNLFTILSLFLALSVFAVIPGPGVLAVSAKALSSGFKPAAIQIMGMVAGDIIYMLFAVFGLSLAAKAMGSFFIIVKFAGAAYLFLLGVKLWISKPIASESEDPQTKKTGKNSLLTGFLISISNPKVIAFYCGFLPNFVDLSDLSITDIFIITGTIFVSIVSVLAAYAFVAVKLKKHLFSQANFSRVNRIAGGFMMAAGVTVAIKS